ncbi:MAG: 2-amino-4-hydroxy-6-hydroxymethyldihydropteridine diphosphokinase [Candidatus Zixiibacteriota bacterium]
MTETTQAPGCRASRAFIGVGSNLGDRLENLRRAAAALLESAGVDSLVCSPIYETCPVGPVGPSNFLNAVFELRVHLSPRQLLRRLLEVEDALGRRSPRSGPRTIDLDLLFYDDLAFQSGDLVVPHPRLIHREFVLRPLVDLAPDLCHPECGSSAAELLDALVTRGEIIQPWPESLSLEPEASRS